MLELNFSPFPQIETSRLILREIVVQDAHDFLEIRSNPNVTKYIDKEPPKNIEQAKDSIDKIINDLAALNGITWGLCLKNNTEKIIGTVGYWRIIKEHYRAEIGYMLHPDHWRKGLTEEAIEGVIRYGFSSMKLHSIQANINPGNSASAALLQKLKFEREAYFKEDFFYRGQFLDSAIYSLLNK